MKQLTWWAHRGSGKGALENTLKAMQTAVDAGFTAVEFDVMLTADGAPVVHHDWVMGRCAVSEDPAMAGTDSITPMASLRARDLRHFKVQGEPIPSFSEVLQFCLENRLQANVELKAVNPRDALQLGCAVRELVDALPSEGLATVRGEWLFSSFYHASLLPLQGFKLALLYEALPPRWIVHADALKAEAIHLHFTGATAEAVRRIHTTGRQVRVYTVNDIELANQLAKLGVAGLFTDRMDFAQHSF